MKKSITIIIIILAFASCSKEEKLLTTFKPHEMSKDITGYAGLGNAAGDIKTRASVPDQSDMAVVGNTVQCSNISITKVKSALGESTDSLVALCQSSKVNKWSNFGPYEHLTLTGTLVNSLKYPYSLGNFAGYNHNATKPGIYSVVPSSMNFGNGTKTQDVTVKVKLGEINFASNAYARYIKVVIKDAGGVERGSSVTEIAQMFTLDGGIGVLDVSMTWYVNSNANFYVYLYLCDYNGGGEVNFPEFSPSTIVGTWIDPTNVTLSLSVSGPIITSASGGLVFTAPDQYQIDMLMVYTGDRVEYTGYINLSYTIYNASGVAVGGDTVDSSTTSRDFSGTINGALGAGYYVIFNVTD